MGRFEQNSRYMRRQGRLFVKSIEELIRKGYRGKYVAFNNGEVLDSDADISVLATRVHEKYGWQKPIYIDRVEREKDRAAGSMSSPMAGREG